MTLKNLLVISNNFPDQYGKYSSDVFVNEQLIPLKQYFENIYVISPLANGIEYLRKRHYEDYSFANVHVYFPKYYNFPLFYKYGRDLWTYFEHGAVLKLIENEMIEFDLIHAHFTWPSGAVAVELKKKFNVPVIITEHTSQTFNNAVEKKIPQFIRSWKLSDAIIRVKKGDISRFNDVGIPLSKVHHIPNGYNQMTFLALDAQDCRIKLDLSLNKKIVLNVGNLYDAVKGHKYLIEAMSEVVKNRNDVLCLIVGGGRLEYELEKQIKSAGLQDYVKLVGGKPHDEIPIWMNACDVFVLPSLNEGNPTVMFECLGCGKPFVGTNVGGIPEIITSEDYGLLCEPEDSEELAKNILMALDKEWDCRKIKEYSRQFTWENLATKMLMVYHSVLR